MSGPSLRGPLQGSWQRACMWPPQPEPEAAPIFEGLASPPCGSFNESPDSSTSEALDDTSDSSLVVRWGREAKAAMSRCQPQASPDPTLLPDRAEPLTPGREPRSSADLASMLHCPWRGRDSAGPAKWG